MHDLPFNKRQIHSSGNSNDLVGWRDSGFGCDTPGFLKTGCFRLRSSLDFAHSFLISEFHKSLTTLIRFDFCNHSHLPLMISSQKHRGFFCFAASARDNHCWNCSLLLSRTLPWTFLFLKRDKDQTILVMVKHTQREREERKSIACFPFVSNDSSFWRFASSPVMILLQLLLLLLLSTLRLLVPTVALDCFSFSLSMSHVPLCYETLFAYFTVMFKYHCFINVDPVFPFAFAV